MTLIDQLTKAAASDLPTSQPIASMPGHEGPREDSLKERSLRQHQEIQALEQRVHLLENAFERLAQILEDEVGIGR